MGTFLALKELADFEGDLEPRTTATPQQEATESQTVPVTQYAPQQPLAEADGVDLRVGYTINLNLPETSDPEVFNAIFRALKENLLKN
ncbi:MAG: hypothetical protein ACFB6S_10165 [Geminicoccaceae bacterium]